MCISNFLTIKNPKMKGGEEMKNKKGFTLIELLIVVAIIGLLATLAIISLTSAQRKARDTKRIADIKSLQNAVEMYYNDYSVYPVSTSWTTLGTIMTEQLNAMPDPPDDNTDRQYQYATEDDGSEYCLAVQLERTAEILDQDSDIADCGLTLSTPSRAASAGTPAQSACTDGAFNLCLGN